MRLQFLGGATTVTGSQFMLSTDAARVIVDCGMFQGSPTDVARNRTPLAYEASELDSLLLTHAHLDHCGLVPIVSRAGFRGPVHSTRATVDLARLVLLDSGKLQVEFAKDRRERDERRARKEARRGREQPDARADSRDTEPWRAHAEQDRRGRGRPWPPEDWQEEGHNPEERLRRQPPEIDTALYEPLYTEADAERSLESFRGTDYGRSFEAAPGITCTLHDAGHILGSAIADLEVSLGNGETRRIVFSGDLGRPGTPIIRDPTEIVDGADYLVVESTYGGREHGPADEAVNLLASAVQEVADSSGVLLVPAFAIGRTQEIVWQLDRLLEAGRIPRMPLYLDSPMASRASDVYREFSGYYDEETERLLKAGETPLDYPDQHITRTAQESKAIEHAKRPMMIVSSNGMLTGGRVVHHLRDLIDDPAATILFVGYQGEGTLGRHLQDGERRVRIDGNWRDVRCRIRSIDGFSAHADESELLDWIGRFARAPRKPRKVFLVHGDPPAAEALAAKVRGLGLEPHLPQWRETVELE